MCSRYTIKNLDLLEQGREESMGNDDVSIVHAHK